MGEGLMSLLAHTNPGFIVILAGMLAYVVRPSLPRASNGVFEARASTVRR